MDKIGADFFNCVKMIKDRTGATPLPIQLPIGAEDQLEGIIDLIAMEEWTWRGEDLGASWTRQPIRDDLKDLADEWRANMIEIVCDQDDDVMEAYLEGNEPDEATPAPPDPQRHAGTGFRACLHRFCVQEQRCPAAAERRDRLSAQPAGRARLYGVRPEGRDRDPRHSAVCR